MKAYSIGDCPVCFDTGAIVVLVSAADQSVLFYCPMCETAWTEPPMNGLHAIASLSEIVPQGAALATREQALACGYPIETIDSEEWDELGSPPLVSRKLRE